MFLKQSTEITLRIGPFLDKTDGVTEETGLAGNGTEISKAGGAFGAGPTLGTHDAEGWYPVTLTTTHTNTVGGLQIKSHDSATHLPVWHQWTVLPANVYDSLVGGTDLLQADVTQFGGTAGTFTAGKPDVQDVKGNVEGNLLGNLDVVLNVDTDGITGNSLAASAITKIQAGLATALGLTTVEGKIDTIDTIVDTIVARVIGTIAAGTHNAQSGDAYARLGAPAGASVSADVAAVKTAVDTVDDLLDTEVAAIKAKTDNLPAAPAATGDIPSAATIADAVWDEARAGHVAAGSFGQGVSSVQGDVTGNVDGNLLGNVDMVLAIDTDAVNANALAANAATEIAAAVLAQTVDGQTVKGALSLLLAAEAGKSSGCDTNAPVFRSADDTANRITATTDANGNRLTITLNPAT